MALETTLQLSGPYTAGAAATTFAYTFRILESGHVKVYKDSVLQTSGYSVTGVGSSGGGSVIFSAPLVGGEVIFLARDTDQFQKVNYNEHEKFPAETHEEALDKATMQVQELRRRAVLIPINEPITSVVLPSLASNPGKLVRVKTTGDGLDYITVALLGAVVIVGANETLLANDVTKTIMLGVTWADALYQVIGHTSWYTDWKIISRTTTQFVVEFSNPADAGDIFRWTVL